MSGLLQGLAAGSQLMLNKERLSNSKSDREWRKYQRGRERGKHSRDDAIRQAGIDALQEESSAGLEPMPTNDTSQIADMGRESTQSQPVRAPGLEIMGGSDPLIADQNQPMEGTSGEDGPGVQGAVGGGQPGMQPMAQGGLSPNPISDSQATQLPPIQAADEGIGQAPQPGLQPIGQPQQQAAQEAGQQPAQQAGGMQPQETFSQMDQMNTVLMARAREAMRQGRPEEALKYQTQGMKVRDQLRGQAFNKAEGIYRQTGNPSVFVEAFNKYLANGVDVKSIRKVNDKVVVQGVTDEGDEFERELSQGEFDHQVTFLRNPKAGRAIEAQRAQAMFKEASKRRSATHEEGEKRKTNKVKLTQEGKNAAGLAKIKGGQDRKTNKAKSKQAVDLQKTKDRFQNITKGGVLVDTWKHTSMNNLGVSKNEIPKGVTDMQKNAVRDIFKANGINDTARFNPKTHAHVVEQNETASNLISSSHGTNAWRRLNPAKAAAIAKSLADKDGKAKRQVRRNSKGKEITVVEYGGEIFPLNRPKK